MNIIVNGKEQEIPGAQPTLAEAVALLCPSTQGIAVASEETVVPRSRWNEHRLREGEQLMIITATQGG